MKDLTKTFLIILVVGIWWASIWITSELIFGDLTQDNSYKPLWVIIPGIVIPFSLWVWYYFKRNKGA